MELIYQFMPLIILMVIMYFMLIRPQKKQQEKKQQMLQSLNRGDRVITIGGLHGVVDEVDTAQNIVIIDCEGVYLTYNLQAVATVISSSDNVRVEELTPESDSEDDFYEIEEEIDDYNEHETDV